jgi:hypothetical protein
MLCSFVRIGQPTYEKVNEELFLDNALHVILNKSKLAYRIYVILIANKELIKKFVISTICGIRTCPGYIMLVDLSSLVLS